MWTHFDLGLSQLTSLLRPVTKRRAESADLVKSALKQLKQVDQIYLPKLIVNSWNKGVIICTQPFSLLLAYNQ